MGFSQIKWVLIFLEKPTLSADNVSFSQTKCIFLEKFTLSDQIEEENKIYTLG